MASQHGRVTFLGQMVMYAVPVTAVRYADLAAWFEELGLDAGYLPGHPTPVNVFRKVTSDMNLRYPAPWVAPDCVANVRWIEDSTARDRSRIVRNAVQTLTVGGRDQAPEVVAQVTFTKARIGRRTTRPAEGIHIQSVPNVLPAEARPHFDRWFSELRHRFKASQQLVDAAALRDIVRSYLTQGFKALLIRDGVYFVYQDLEQQMKQLKILVPRFGDDASIHGFEVLDTPEHRGFLHDALREHLGKQAHALRRRLKVIRGDGSRPIKTETWAPFQTAYEHLLEFAEDYTRALDAGDVGDTLDALVRDVVQARQQVERPGVAS